MPWATKALLRCWREYRYAIPGQAFVVALVSTWVSASRASKYVTNRVTFGFTWKISKVGISMSWSSTTILEVNPQTATTRLSGDNWSLLQVCGGCTLQPGRLRCGNHVQITVEEMVCQTRHAYAHAIRQHLQLTPEVSNEFMRASQLTKVTSTAGHPRTQGLVERQNRTLLTLSRLFCSRRMRVWDQHLNEVMGAYNWTRHATTGFLTYMLTRKPKKLFLSFICILSSQLDNVHRMEPM